MSRGKWIVLMVVAVAMLVVPAMVARGAGMPEEARVRMERRERGMRQARERIEALRQAARMFEERGMPEMAETMHERAEDMEAELGEMLERGRPERPMAHMGEMARRHTEMLEGLTEGQEQIKRHLRELTEQVQALRKEVHALREQREK